MQKYGFIVKHRNKSVYFFCRALQGLHRLVLYNINYFWQMNFTDDVTSWYHKNKRDLPWRHTTDAYVIWLSEIILQQTRVEQGMPYFNRFLDHYPTVAHFAAAPEDDILKLWQGLGYYSRGRNMLLTAKLVNEQFDGRFPDKFDQLIKLKGIGEYTASAISSFAANEARAVVDGNVSRVLARYFGIEEPINSTKGKKLFQETANSILNREHAGLHNQAMMEFGAIICKPKKPACGICPVQPHCYAFLNNVIVALPKKIKTIKVRERFFTYLVVTDGRSILLNKRGDKDIWANMYDLPMIETAAPTEISEILKAEEFTKYFGTNAAVVKTDGPYKHILTHQRLIINFVFLEYKPVELKEGWFYAEVDVINKFALPRILFIFLTKLFKY